MFTYYSISALINFLFSLFSSVFLMVTEKKNLKNKTIFAFFRFAFFVIFWSAFYFLWQISNNYDNALLYSKILISFAAFIPVAYLDYVLRFVGYDNKIIKFFIIISYIIFFIFVFTGLVTDVAPKLSFAYWPIGTGMFPSFLFLWSLFFLISPIVLVYFLFNKNKTTNKNYIFFLLVASLLGIIGGITNYFLWFDIPIKPIGNILVSIYFFITLYTVRKYNTKNIRLFYVELASLIITMYSFGKIFVSLTSFDFYTNIIFFIVSSIASIYIIRSAQREVKDKEEVEKLAEKLDKANEELKAIDERKSDFINIASHQLRTPTTAIKGYTALLLEGAYGGVPEKEKEIIQRMNGLADQNVKIIADMLNISRIEQNRMKYTFEKVEIAQFILDIIHTLKIKAEGKKLPLDYTFDKTLNDSLTTDKKVYASVDKTLLAQVFENVIDNSVKYTQKGSVDIDIRLEGKKLIFKCKDTGIGIDKESLATLFKKFGRSKNAQASGIEGTGIGLYIAKDIMEKHHGDITITSEGENRGSESIVTLEVE